MRPEMLQRVGLVVGLAIGMLVALLPAGLAAQSQFEGVITFTMDSHGTTNAQHIEATVRVKGQASRLDGELPGQGKTTYIRDEKGRVITLIPAERRYYIVPDPATGFAQAAGGLGEGSTQYIATGRSETVAGYPCKYYQVLDHLHAKTGDESCITAAFGFVGVGPMGINPTGRRVTHALFPNGYLVLKRQMHGVTAFAATKIERTTVSDSLFAIPAGYTEGEPH